MKIKRLNEALPEISSSDPEICRLYRKLCNTYNSCSGEQLATLVSREDLESGRTDPLKNLDRLRNDCSAYAGRLARLLDYYKVPYQIKFGNYAYPKTLTYTAIAQANEQGACLPVSSSHVWITYNDVDYDKVARNPLTKSFSGDYIRSMPTYVINRDNNSENESMNKSKMLKEARRRPHDVPEGITVMTIRQDYKMNGEGYGSIDEYSEDYYDMPASEIAFLYSSDDGSNTDVGIETVNSGYYIAYSGHGVESVSSREEMLNWFTDGADEVDESLKEGVHADDELTRQMVELLKTIIAGDNLSSITAVEDLIVFMEDLPVGTIIDRPQRYVIQQIRKQGDDSYTYQFDGMGDVYSSQNIDGADAQEMMITWAERFGPETLRVMSESLKESKSPDNTGSYTESLKEASYGGAFDIEDNQFFTRDDLNELMDVINEKCPEGFSATEIYMGEDGKTLEVVFSSEDWGDESIFKIIDMRKIRKPSDLNRYADELVEIGLEKMGIKADPLKAEEHQYRMLEW